MHPISIQVQDDEVGDGTTSVCVLASELLREAERLVHIIPVLSTTCPVF
jgi:chaperonin GroEL (HSP60 family)